MMQAVRNLVLIFLSIASLPAIAVAATPAHTRYVYPTPSIFAWEGTKCPAGSTAITDDVYQQQARKSDAIYCLFPAPIIDVDRAGNCPSGFAPTGVGLCRDERGPR